ncbi:MAG: aminopeptidase N [Planctomycetota bacterium]|nr:MAG: aminopeptidase N [Planctomycetota bacterium]
MSTTTTQSQPQAVYLKDYQPPAFWIETVDLKFELGEEETRVRARLQMQRNREQAGAETPLRLVGEELDLLEVKLNGVLLGADDYRVDSESLTVPQVPDQFELETLVLIKPQENTKLEGLYKSSGNFCTQCEAEGFRRITYYLDRPDVMATFSTTIVADWKLYPVMLSNGNLVQEKNLEDGRRLVRWQDPFKKPSYLFALVAGRLLCKEDEFVTMSGRKVKLQIFVEPANIDKCDHAMDALKMSMKWDEETFGLEYDLDIYMIVAVNDFNMGAMENKGLNIFNSKYVLARPETATDDDFEAIVGVIGHEYFHNWTGNRVTCRDWFQLSLKEGLTVFRDQIFSADMTSEAVKRIHDVNLLRTRQFPEDGGPMAHPVRPESYIQMNNFYTMTVYIKGAEVVRMYQTLLGKEGFRKGMDLYFQRHDGQAVTCDDFRAAMADANGYDLNDFVHWYSQAGTPQLEVQGDYHAESQSYALTVRQSCPPTPGQDSKQPFMLPLAMGLLDSRGRELPLQVVGETSQPETTKVLVLHDREETFVFENVPEAPVPSLLRGFSAPVKLKVDRSRADLGLLLAHDPDPFARWEAGQLLAMDVLLEQMEHFQKGEMLKVDDVLTGAFRNLLAEVGEDLSSTALSLALPNEEYLAEQVDVVDVQAIHEAREFVKRSLATDLGAAFRELYRRLNTGAAYRFDQSEVGRRRLKNICLAFLGSLADAEAVSLAMDQYRRADNMTDSLAALGVLCQIDCPEREEALADFAERWQEDPLVMDKWFILQATSSLAGTLQQVEKLQEHPAFSIKNPNKVRSLVGAFCMNNPLHFHAADGSGYRFLGDRVVELNAINPQIGARMVQALSRWRRYPEENQAMMTEQLQRIAELPDLAKDIYEIVQKSLQG